MATMQGGAQSLRVAHDMGLLDVHTEHSLGARTQFDPHAALGSNLFEFTSVLPLVFKTMPAPSSPSPSPPADSQSRSGEGDSGAASPRERRAARRHRKKLRVLPEQVIFGPNPACPASFASAFAATVSQASLTLEDMILSGSSLASARKRKGDDPAPPSSSSVESAPASSSSSTPAAPSSSPSPSRLMVGKAISTYPETAPGQRQGDPIADQFGVARYGDGSIVAVIADGCNWGKRALEAATRARDTFVSYMLRKRPKLVNSLDAVHFSLRGFNRAHESIIKDKLDPSEAGSTTLLAAVVLRVASAYNPRDRDSGADDVSPPSSPPPSPPRSDASAAAASSSQPAPSAAAASSSGALGRSPRTRLPGGASTDDFVPYEGPLPNWQILCTSVGDCRAYLLTSEKKGKRTIRALQAPSNILYGGTDPGGRLGSFVSDHPDLRNFSTFSAQASEDDLLLMFTDGVTDNLDPRHFGMEPSEVAGLEGLASWENATVEHTPIIYKWIGDKILELLLDVKFRPNDIVERLLSHCNSVTESSRQFIQQNPAKRLPKDYKTFPGKMDHTTCVCIRIHS